MRIPRQLSPILVLPLVAAIGCAAWKLDGNSGTDPAGSFLGTTDDQPLVIRTANREAVRVTASGNVGIGSVAPTARLEVEGQVRITGGSPGGGKVLTSDATGLASWQTPFALTVRTSQFSISPGNLRETAVSCQANEAATGGGFQMTDDPKLNVWKNGPTSTSSGWAFGISNYGTATRTVTLSVTCMRIG